MADQPQVNSPSAGQEFFTSPEVPRTSLSSDNTGSSSRDHNHQDSWQCLPGKRLEKKPKRSRLSPQADAMTFAFLLERQQGNCYTTNCQERPIQIHHVDGNTYNWDPANLRASCQTHNPRGLMENVNQREKQFRAAEPDTGYTPIDLSREYRPAFERWLFRRVSERKPLYLHDAIHDPYNTIGCSPQTVRSYLGSMVSESGLYEIVPVTVGKKHLKQVVFRDGWARGAR